MAFASHTIIKHFQQLKMYVFPFSLITGESACLTVL